MKSKSLVFATIALATHSALATNIFWADIAGNTNWTNGSSWVAILPNPATAPANSAVTDTATFTSVANSQPYLNVGATTRSVNGIDFQLPAGGLNFTSDVGSILRLGATGIDATTQLSGESTVGVTNIKVEGASHEWNLFSNTDDPAPGTTTSTFTVSSTIDLGTVLAVRSNRNSASGNVGIVNLSGAISGTNNITLIGASAARNTINLSGNSSYIGTTTITQVTATANSLVNGGSNSALGNSGNIILGTNAAVAYLTFQNLSVDGSTDRQLSLKGTTTGNPYILANNDADNTIAFTNAGNTGDTVGTYTTDLVFGLGGTNTGSNTFGQIINDRNATNKTSLRKENPGTWVLTNSNTYTGETVVNSGLLRIDNVAALGGGNLDISGGVLGLGAGDLTTRTVGTLAGQVQWTGSGGFAAFGGERIVSFGTPGTSINWNATNFIGTGFTLILGHATADSTLNWDQALSLAGSTRTVQVNNGSAAIDAKMSRSIGGGTSGTLTNIFNKSGTGTLALTANNFYWGDTTVSAGTLMIGAGATTGGVSTNSPNIIVSFGATLAVNRSNTLTQGTANLIAAISGDGGFAQVGSGTTEFALANVYTGPTTISAGTLKLNVSGVLPDTSAVSIGSATLNTADGVAETTGTLAVTGTATINLGTGATLVFADSNLQDWTGGSLNITGAFTNTSIKFATNSGLGSGQLAVISVNGSGAGTYTLDASGYLVTGGGGSPYETWATGDESFDGDANGDGVQDGLAFLLGAATPGTNAIGLLPTVTQSGGNLVLDFDCLPVSARGGATFKVEHSTDLVGWTATTAAVPDATNAVPDNNVTFVVGAGPVGPPALNSVQATIGSAAAADGKLFGRLKAENP